MTGLDGSSATAISLGFMTLNIFLSVGSFFVPWMTASVLQGLGLLGHLQAKTYLTKIAFWVNEGGSVNTAAMMVNAFFQKLAVMSSREEVKGTDTVIYTVPLKTMSELGSASVSYEAFFPEGMTGGWGSEGYKWLYYTGMSALVLLILSILLQVGAIAYLYHYSFVQPVTQTRKIAQILSISGMSAVVIATTIYGMNFVYGKTERSMWPDFISAQSEAHMGLGFWMMLLQVFFCAGVAVLMGSWTKGMDEGLESTRRHYDKQHRMRRAHKYLEKRNGGESSSSSDSSSSSSSSSSDESAVSSVRHGHKNDRYTWRR